MRNLEIIGEAAKHIPVAIRAPMPETDWRRIKGMRDILAHAYLGIDNDSPWDVVTNYVLELQRTLEERLEQSDSG